MGEELLIVFPTRTKPKNFQGTCLEVSGYVYRQLGYRKSGKIQEL